MDTQIVETNEALAGSGDRRESQKPAQRKLARAHYLILSQMAANPGNPLRKLQGGFWVVDPDAAEYREGEWFASTNAVTVMVRFGFVRFLGNSSAVELTQSGIEALKTGFHTPLE